MAINFHSAQAFREIEPQSIIDALRKNEAVTWIDVDRPTQADLEKLRDIFNFHQLALDDTLHQNQFPKAEEYEDHLFIVLKPITRDGDGIEFRDLEVFVGPNYVVTTHPGIELVVDEVKSQLDQRPVKTPFSGSPTQILYTLLDLLIEKYKTTLTQVEDEIEVLGSQVVTHPTQDTINQLFKLRANFNNLSRIIVPQRDILDLLVNHDIVFIDQNSQYYLRDVSNHLVQVIDRIRFGQDNLNALMNLYVSSVSNSLSQRVNRLTALAIAIGVVTMFTGFYGMNFENTWPSWSEPLAVPLILALITISIGVFLALLRWKKW